MKACTMVLEVYYDLLLRRVSIRSPSSSEIITSSGEVSSPLLTPSKFLPTTSTSVSYDNYNLCMQQCVIISFISNYYGRGNIQQGPKHTHDIQWKIL